MDAGQTMCPFDKLFTKNRPHILERICLYLDYESFKRCLKVSKTWNDLLTSEAYLRKVKQMFKAEILSDQENLCYASRAGNAVEIRRLISSGLTDVNAAIWANTTPLHVAVKADHIDIVKLLLENGADPNKESTSGMTPLWKATWKGREDVVKILLDFGADPNKADDDGYSPLYCALCMGHHEIALLLLTNGADCNETTDWGWTPLHHLGIVQMLLDKGVDPNMANKYGNTALHVAANGNNKRRTPLLYLRRFMLRN